MNTTLALVLLAVAPGADAVGPLTAAAPTADLGEVKSGPVREHTFELKHAGGGGAVGIVGVTAGCGCVKTELSAKTLRPGGSAKLTVWVNTLTQKAGANVWPVTVRYAIDGQEAALDLKVTATVVREVTVTPPLLAVSTAGAVTQTLKIEDRRPKPLTVSKVTTTNPAVTAAVNGFDITVKVADDLPAGSHDDTVTIHTTDPECPQLVVPVKVHKRGADDPAATPAAPTVRFAKGQVEASTLVQIRHGGKAVGVAKVECKTPGVTAKHSEGSGPVATVRVFVDAKAAGGSGQAEVTVTLAEPAGKTLVLPVSWFEP
jgi:hypothetical protein